MRVMLGTFASMQGPASYALISDYFPPASRATANAIESSGTYVGGALASFCVILIKQFGWRAMYQIVGLSGVIIGLTNLLIIKEPVRGRFKPKDAKEEEPE